MKNETIRRSVTFPKELDDIIAKMVDKYSYTVKNDLLVELLELGIIKFNEDMELKNIMLSLISKVNELINYFEDSSDRRF